MRINIETSLHAPIPVRSMYLSVYTLYAVPISLPLCAVPIIVHTVCSTYHFTLCTQYLSLCCCALCTATYHYYCYTQYLPIILHFFREGNSYNFRACYFSILGAEFFDRKFCSKQIVPTHSGPYHWTLMCTV